MKPRIGFIVSHPIQYYAPLFRALAERCDLSVFFAHRQSPEQQAKAGYGVSFEWDVDLLSGFESRFLVNVARRPNVSRFNGCDTPGIADEVARGHFDGFVVPGWSLRSYWQAARACRRHGVPVLVRGDSKLAGRRSAALLMAKALALPRILRLFDGYLYVGRRHREYLEHYGVPADRLFFSPHCVDNDAFAAAAAKARRDAPSEGGAPVRRVLFVGRLIPEKRPDDVLRAVAGLGLPAVEVVFAGAGRLEPALRQAAREAGVQARFLGFVNQAALPAAYASAAVLVLPSSEVETWGLVVNEAMACGVPAVVSDVVGCAPDLVDAGRTGEVFPMGNVEALSQAIARILSVEPITLRRHLAAKMEIYSPARAAAGIVDAVPALTSVMRRARPPAMASGSVG
ncbi:MAG: glycosyltransferase family 4 protein [Pseudomonadota bacterium]